MNPTATSQNFINQMPNLFLGAIQKGTVDGIKIVWNLVTSFLIEHWIAVVVILFVVLVYAVIQAIMGHWGFLGHVLYNYLYWGAVLAIGSIWGSQVFAGAYTDLGLFLLYIACYIAVDRILTKTGLKRYY